MKKELSKHSPHREIMLLIPWHVNGTLQEDEKARVEAHLKTCLSCRADYAEQQKIYRMMQASDPFAAQAEASFARLSDRIRRPDAEPPENGKVVALADSKRDVVNGRVKKRGTFSLTFFAQAAAVVIGIGVLTMSYYLHTPEQPAHLYRTLSSSKHQSLPATDIRVVFSESAGRDRIDRALAPFAGKIVAGPSAQGVYVVRIAPEKLVGKNALIDLVAKLRADDAVIFAEPSYSALTAGHSG